MKESNDKQWTTLRDIAKKSVREWLRIRLAGMLDEVIATLILVGIFFAIGGLTRAATTVTWLKGPSLKSLEPVILPVMGIFSGLVGIFVAFLVGRRLYFQRKHLKKGKLLEKERAFFTTIENDISALLAEER